ncbi:MAG: preprotein translocase subunit YajC [Eubacteriales bacterium]|jgi:preprotein translocase subunit YajC|nr:preprotein translocase subunit YajC [Eubacteriales bacterium]MDD3197294.1 preprotein translocase subunit YajC [Eubacteriales bacterium]MDD3503791.1 preprotein translocase subunit YajC [Eubacteriales bacterium]MDD4682403.1 preprotein translocase subunit YajC [Eubacteriales bacterium]
MKLADIFLTAGTTTGGIEGLLGLVLPLALMFGLMYFLLIRPQRKKEKKLREQINAMVVGDNVVTIGGVAGRVVNIKDDEVTISTSVANTLVTFKKSAVNTVVKPVSE